MNIMIGCPIFQRDWIIDDWFEMIAAQDFPLKKIGFIFETHPGDIKTIEKIVSFQEKHPEIRCMDILETEQEIHEHHPEGGRKWNTRKYQNVVYFRNKILDKVTCYEPDRYFSLDSDILLEDSRTISELIQLTSALDAVSPLIFMTPGHTQFPGVMTWIDTVGYKAARIMELYPLGKLFQADIIMAAVMMSKKTYMNARYTVHRQGEDLGWSLHCAKLGYELYCASYIYAAHIMSQEELKLYKENGDRRKHMLIKEGWPYACDKVEESLQEADVQGVR